jgi:photosystem II stability/assembly factor-like uncharacterized protein
MTDPRDGLDTWLHAQVQPMPPPPGTFELIRKRARRRKTTRAVAAAAGAAAVIAVIATVPRLVINQLNVGPGPVPSGVQAGQTSSVGAHQHHQTAPASPSVTPSSEPPATAPPAVPANFAATSVTFVGPDIGYVVGQAGTPGQCTGPDPRICTSLAGTTDAGHTWHGVPAPVAGPPAGPAGVSQVRFFDTSNGWAFGPQLWATHDGGHSWQQISTGGMRVIALEAAGQRVFAVWAQCTGRGADFATGCTSAALYSAAPGGDHWAPVAGTGTGFTMSSSAGSAALVLTSHRGYLLPPDGVLLSGPVTGRGSWQPVTGSATPCLPGTAQASGQPSAALLATTTASAARPGLVLVCAGQAAGGSQQKTVYTSADGGQSWQQAGQAPAAGTATSVAGSTAGTIVLATTQGLQVSTDGGATWTAGQGTLPPGGFSYVGMTEPKQGVAVPADPDVHAVWFTYDGGTTWRKSPIS